MENKINKENPLYWETNFNKHNPNLANPLAYSVAKKLLEYGFDCNNAAYGNDDCHRIDFQFKDRDVSIFLPNAKKTNFEQEEYSTYTWSIDGNGEFFASYDVDDKNLTEFTTEKNLLIHY